MHGEVTPKICGRVHFDEKVLFLNGKWCYDLNALDQKTKYVLAHLFVEKRTLSQCKKFLQQIKTTCYGQMLEHYRKEKGKSPAERKLITFVCDRFENYRTAFNKLFYRVAKLSFGVPIACKKYGLEHNNNPIERYNGDPKDRTKILRGGFRSFAGGEGFMNLKHIIHNFVNPHQSLHGKTPAEAAGVDFRLGRQKLLNLIKQRAQTQHHSRR